MKETNVKSHNKHERIKQQKAIYTCSFCGVNFKDCISNKKEYSSTNYLSPHATMVKVCVSCHQKHEKNYIKILEAASTILCGTLYAGKSSWNSQNYMETCRGEV